MGNSNNIQSDAYLPVDPDFPEIIENEKRRTEAWKVFYFSGDQQVEESKGALAGTFSDKNGEFLQLKGQAPVRLDKIITLNGRPGPAYPIYDKFANACLTCMAGYEEE